MSFVRAVIFENVTGCGSNEKTRLLLELAEKRQRCISNIGANVKANFNWSIKRAAESRNVAPRVDTVPLL